MQQEFSTDNHLKYCYFLFGILLYKLFYYICGIAILFQVDLEFLVNPVPVEIGIFIIELTLFFYVFRKPFLPDIKWKHLIAIGMLIEVLRIAEYFIKTYLLQPHFNYSILENLNTGNILVNTRACTAIAGMLLVLAYLWWHYHLENKNNETKTSDTLSHCFYGGVLFIFTFDYLLGTIHTIAFQCRGLQNPLPINITANLTYLLLTIGAVYLLIKKRHRITISLAIILIIVVINKFSFYFLYDILNKYNLIVETVVHADKYFSYTSLFHLFDFSFFIAVFILYRKAMKEVSMAEKM